VRVAGLVCYVAGRCAWRVLRGRRVRLEIAEHVGKVARIFVHSQHPRTVLVDQSHAARPEPLARITARIASRQASHTFTVDEERLERVADLIAHVRVGQVQARQNDRL